MFQNFQLIVIAEDYLCCNNYLMLLIALVMSNILGMSELVKVTISVTITTHISKLSLTTLDHSESLNGIFRQLIKLN